MERFKTLEMAEWFALHYQAEHIERPAELIEKTKIYEIVRQRVKTGGRDTMTEITDEERIRSATAELHEFEIDVSLYSVDDIHKITNLLMMYLSATERMGKKDFSEE